MEFKILFNDNNSVEILDEELQKIGINELLQRLRDSDYNEDHKIVFCTPDNNKIYLTASEGLGTTLYRISVNAMYNDQYDIEHNTQLEEIFNIESINCNVKSFQKLSYFSSTYYSFNEKINDIIESWWKMAFYFSENKDFRNTFNTILKIEFQRAIEYRINNFSRIKEKILACQKRLLMEKKQIDDKLINYSLLLSMIEGENNKRLRLKK